MAQNLPDGVYLEKDGIAYRKTATLKEGTTDKFIINLEAFVTGEVTVKNNSIPADIVLVLDVSGSMDDDMYSYTYTARSSQNYSYNTSNITDYYYKYNDEYCKINQETQAYYNNLLDWGSYYRLYFITSNGTKYYLTRSGNNNIITTTPPTNVTGYLSSPNTTIWAGVLYTAQRVSVGTKINALKTAVNAFIATIQHNDLYDDDGNRRKDINGQDTSLGNQISIVKFAGDALNNTSEQTAGTSTYEYDFNVGSTHYAGTSQYTEVLARFLSASDDYTTLTGIVNNLYALGGTSSDYGTTKANQLFSWLETNYPNRESSRTVVFFTDGSPTHTTGFDDTVASSTIGNAYTLKSTHDATVFTVGVFSDLGSSEVDVNTYMNFTSSNYPEARTMSQGGTPIADNKRVYYQNASGADLTSVFTTIAEASGGSGNTEVTSTSSVTVDVVASSFSLPTNVSASDITVKVAPCNGKRSITYDGVTKDYLTFGTAKAATEYGLSSITPEVDSENNTVSTSGFDFSANWCGYDEEHSQYHGYKQIISFEVTVAEGAVGGPNVATNDKKSGIYVNGRQIAEFNRPTVKIPISIWIKKQGLIGTDTAVFTIYYATYVPGVDPMTLSDDKWQSFTKVMISHNSPKDVDGLPMEKLVGLDPDYFYRIKEDKWAWSYSYQDGGVQYTFGEDLQNPFLFKNNPKETVKEAEATVRNEFNKKTAPSNSSN